jgi:hypothetical protein
MITPAERHQQPYQGHHAECGCGDDDDELGFHFGTPD